jgi:hypothetical protein
VHILNFELTPIHGTSCLVTMVKASARYPVDAVSPGLQKRLDLEVADGIATDFFHTKFGKRAHHTRAWMGNQLRNLERLGYIIGAYGAAAKGMVLSTFYCMTLNQAQR